MDTQQLPYSTAMLLVSHHDMAAADRHVLKQATLRVKRTFISGFDAAKYLDTVHSQNIPLPDCILCDEQLNDMQGQAFIKLMRLHPAFMAYPLIIIISNKTKTPAGCSGTLIRPYTLEDLQTQLILAEQCQNITEKALQSTAPRTHNAFNAELAKLVAKEETSTQEIENLYREALFAFKMKQHNKAIIALQRCLKLNENHHLAQQTLATILEHKVKQRAQLSVTKVQHTKKQAPKQPSSSTATQQTNRSKFSNKTSKQDKHVPIPALDALPVAETPQNKDKNAPIPMHLNPANQDKNQKITMIKEPSKPKLLTGFPLLHEILVIARITISLIRRL